MEPASKVTRYPQQSSVMPAAGPESDAPPPRAASWVPFVLGVATVVLAAVWFFLHGSALHAGARAEGEAAVSRSQALLDQMSEDVQLRLRTEAQLMSEDPRLKSTLATPGIDEATITDVLQDLKKQTSAELLTVLSPTARVRAQVGAEYLKGLDLSTSSVIRAAQASEQPSVGTWVVAERVLNVSAKAIRVENQVVAFLVVGAPMAEAALKRVYQVTGAGVALLVGERVALGYPSQAAFPTAFAELAKETQGFDTTLVTLGGREYVARLSDVQNAVPPARVAVVLPSDEPLAPFQRVRALAYVPAVVAVLFAVVAIVRGRLFR